MRARPRPARQGAHDNEAMRNLLRSRTGGTAQVSQVELFFDLVFAFAVTQLSHSLLSHFTLAGALQVAMLFLAVWWAWIFTTWVTNWLDPQTTPVRLLLFALMAAGLFMSMAIPQAFGERGLVFALAFAAIQVGRSLFMLAALRSHSPGNFRNFQRITAWLGCAALLWVAGGVADGAGRMALWAAALAIEYAAPALGFAVPGLGRSHSREWDVDGRHIAERASCFIIIALGESIVITGAGVAAARWDAATLGAFAAALVASISLWWLYFDATAEGAARHIGTSEDPGRIARLVYTYIHLAIVGGVIISAASDEIVLARPLERASLGAAAATVGGAALFLAGTLLLKRAVWRVWPRPELAALAALALLAVLAPQLNLLTLALATSATLVVAAVWSGCSARAAPVPASAPH